MELERMFKSYALNSPSDKSNSMPTFMIFRSGTVINTIRGADRGALTNAIEAAVKLAGAPAPAYASTGRTLGGTSPRGTSMSQPFNIQSLVDTVIAFLALYFVSLFSLDAYGAAEKSPFNINGAPAATTTGTKPKTGTSTQTGRKVGTIADLGSD